MFLYEHHSLGMKSVSPHQLPVSVCNCWCTNWAEIYIRAPSGNMSWMMRVENEYGLYATPDSQVSMGAMPGQTHRLALS